MLIALVVAMSGVVFINPKHAFAASSNCTWTNSSNDSMFSTGANWSNCAGTYPHAGDNIIFGTPVGGRTVSLQGVSEATYGSITFNDNDYYIEQGRMDVTGGVTDNSTGGENRILSDVGVYGSSAINGGNSNLVLDHAIVGSTSTVSFSHVTVYNLSGGNSLSVLNIGSGVSILGSGGGTLTGLNINTDFTTDGSLDSLETTVASGATFTVSSGDTVTSSPVTVSNGATLVLDGTITGDIAISSGGIIKGSGTETGSTTVQQGGTIAPGHSPGCLTTGNLTVNGTYQAEIGGTTACSGYDQLTGTNLVDVTNGTLTVSLVNGFTPTAGQTFTIVKDQDTGPVNGTFSGLPEGSTFTASGYTFKISYVGGDGNDIVLTAVGPASGSKAPGTPNTGFAALLAHPLATLVGTSFAAFVIFVVARRLRPARS